MASVRIVKEFTYRGQVTEFSNRYHIGVNFPSSSGAWDLLLSNIMTAEAKMWPSFADGGARVVRGVGLGPNSNIPVHELVSTHDGQIPLGGIDALPGDVAAIMKCTTPDRSVRNHPIYLFSYFHAAQKNIGSPADELATVQHTAMNTYCSEWLAGFSDGNGLYHRSRPNNGTLITGAAVDPLVTHRDLTRL